MHSFGLPDKGYAILGLVVCNSLDVSAFGSDKMAGPTFLSYVAWGIG